MNVLELCQAAAYEMNLQAPSSLIATTDTALHWKHLLYAVSRELRATQAYPQQKRSHSFTTSNGRGSYPLPADFWSGILGSRFDRANQWELVGPVPDGDWNYYLYGPGYGATRKMYRVFGPDRNQGTATAGGQLQLYPVPSAAEVISFDYISASLFLPPAWTASTAISLNDYRNANGQIYICTDDGTTSTTPPDATSGTDTDGTVTWTVVTTAYETIQTNSDLSLFDDDVVIEGLKYRYQAANNQDFQLAYKNFQTMKDTARARWIGPYKGRFDKRPNRSPYVVRF